ncbi:hypothetical protein M427DRAFT_44132 [Gonapodya prolifera JEL478]|uniref:Amino acid permease/ SLC12A domain-containing protein n=1 Tax=Gonapodya prolifera (strain JEL478) TaxID=1344416 RepID=A0A139AGU6_GONPJ|nr:hypothetical protein M427DRAFT_44132 [Gonapodya prolifera JEL478]|eukprot:KXS15968.1 hypothetical protein M427DRAFT_44132 [Gonapodya prolifera JEL478]
MTSIEQFVQSVSQDIRTFAGNEKVLPPLDEKEAELDALEDIRHDAEFFFKKVVTDSSLSPQPDLGMQLASRGSTLSTPHGGTLQRKPRPEAKVSFIIEEKKPSATSDSLSAPSSSTAGPPPPPPDGEKKDDPHVSSSTALGSILSSINSGSRRRRNTVGELIVPVEQLSFQRRSSVLGEYGDPTSLQSITPDGATLVRQWYLRVRKWWHEKVLMDVYPDDSTVSDRWLLYMDRRVPPVFKASLLQLLGLGVSAVISGEFAGWNIGLHAGYGGFWVATVVAGIMYLCLALCLAEMSTSIPCVGGAYAYSRAVLNSSMGFVIGNSELLEYSSFICLCLVGMSSYVSEMLGIDHAEWGPLIMVIYLTWGVILITRYNYLSWNLMAFLALTSVLQIFVFCAIAANQLDTSMAFGSPAEFVPPTDPCVCAEVNATGDCIRLTGKAMCEISVFSGGVNGIITMIPDAAWWFTGLECLSVASKEMVNPAVNTPRSLMATWGVLAMCAALLMVFNVLVKPGIYTMEDSGYPMVDVMAYTYGESWRRPFILYLMPPYLCNLMAMLWAAGRQLWALSRTGFLPHFLSVTSDNKDFVPWRATVAVAIFNYIVSVVVWTFQKWYADLDPISLLLNLTVVSGFIA